MFRDRPFTRAAAWLPMAALLSACTALPRAPWTGTVAPAPRALQPPAVEQPVTPPAPEQAGESSFETAEEDAFLLRQQNESQPLPAIEVPPMSFSNATPYEMVRALVESVKLGVALVGDGPNSNVQRTTVSAWMMGGRLADVLERLSAYTGLFYSYRDGVLTFSPDAHFMATLPPVEDLIDPLSAVIRSMGATDVQVDRFNRVMSFRCTRTVLPRIEAYLKHIRERRQVITYDVSIYEVQLNDASQLGVNWNRFAMGRNAQPTWYNNSATNGAAAAGTTGGTGSAAGVTPALLPDWMPFRDGAGNAARQAVNIASAVGGGMSVNPFLLLPGLNLDVLVNFLQSQGTLRSISQPRVSLVTGTKAAVRVGSTTSYVSRVGTNIGTGSTSTSVETAQLKTGVDLRINADFQNGTVYTDLQISIADLVRMRSFVALGTTLQLPETSDRLIETRVRARPGDTIVIGGIQRDSSNQESEGVPAGGNDVLPTSKSRNSTRSELVVTLRPRVLSFMPAGERKAAAAAATQVSAAARVTSSPATLAEPPELPQRPELPELPIGPAAPSSTEKVIVITTEPGLPSPTTLAPRGRGEKERS